MLDQQTDISVFNAAVLQVRTRAWFMPDHRFLVAKCYVHLRFSSAAAYSSARAANLANLLVYALRDALAEFCYTAATAGSWLPLRSPAADTIIVTRSRAAARAQPPPPAQQHTARTNDGHPGVK